MFRKKVKKAFTLVELLVVIAILAILATVSVVGYTQFTKRAQQSNDMSLTTQINTVLQADEVTGKPQTMTEAIAVMEEAGANIAELTPTTENYSYVWNSATNRVILLDEKKNVVAPADATIDNPADCYAIIKAKPDLTTWAGYSLYLTKEYTDDVKTDVFDLTSGLVNVDVGTSAIKNLTVDTDASGTATIYTNGGSVTIDAPNATINHYGTAASVDVQAVANNSYHLYATVSGNITLAAGRLVAEANSSAAAVIIDIDSAAAADTVKIEITVNATINAVAATESGVIENVEIIGKENTSVETIVVDPTNKDFAGGFGTEASPWLVSNETQLINISKYTSEKHYYKQVADFEVSRIRADVPFADLYGEYDADGHSITIASSDSTTGDVAVLFQEHLEIVVKNLTTYSRENGLLCVFESYENGSTITLSNIKTRVVDNATVKINNSNSAFLLHGHTSSGNIITIENCDVNGSLTNTGTCTAAFIGGGLGWSSTFGGRYTTLTMRNCSYTGKITGSAQAGLILGNATHFNYVTFEQADSFITLDNVVNAGTISAISNAGGIFSTANTIAVELGQKYVAAIGGSYIKGDNVLTGADIEIYFDGTNFTIGGEDYTSEYTYQLGISPSRVTVEDGSSFDGRTLFITLQASTSAGTVFDTKLAHHAYNYNAAVTAGVLAGTEELNYSYIFENAYDVALYVKDGNVYMIFEEGTNGYPKVNCAVSFSVIAIDKAGNQVGSVRL